MNTLDLIIPRLYDIAITMGIISVCYTLWIQGRYYGEDLTMEEKQNNSYRKLPTLCEECGNTSCGEMDICHGCINRCVCLTKKEKENLTMEEKPIRIILENYNNEKITFTMPSDATIESMIEMSDKTFKIGRVFIDAKADDITIKKEDFTKPD